MTMTHFRLRLKDKPKAVKRFGIAKLWELGTTGKLVNEKIKFKLSIKKKMDFKGGKFDAFSRQMAYKT